MGMPPLHETVKSTDAVAIAVCDITRPIPTDRVLPPILEELAHVPREQIVILIATGSHRANTRPELEEMLGREVVRDYRVVNHTAFDKETLRYVGDTSTGIPIWLNRLWLDADVRVATGLVEPHFFAGFSGGPKVPAIGLAGIDTILGEHSPYLVGHPRSTWGVIDDNPMHTVIREIARRTGVDFNLNMIVNKEHRIVRAYAGDLWASHKAACQEARRIVMRPVPEPYDIVITTNSGYPLDLNCAAECSDGIPEHGEYKRLLASVSSPEEFLKVIRTPDHHPVMDQWEVQLQAQVQMKATVYLKSSLPDDDARAAHMLPISSVEEALKTALEQMGDDARICVLPEGPQTIPYVDEEAA
jgi:nickel-dependent lactate racemase